jgi:hypothetical protein
VLSVIITFTTRHSLYHVRLIAYNLSLQVQQSGTKQSPIPLRIASLRTLREGYAKAIDLY